MKFFWIILFSVFLSGVCFGASQSDSLNEKLNRLKGDEKVQFLLKISKDNWDINPRNSLAFANDAYQIAQGINNKILQADALNRMGTAYYFLEIPDSALGYFQQSLAISNTFNYGEGISRATNNMGLIFVNFGDYEKAINYYLQSLEIEQKTKNQHGIASAYLNISSVYYFLDEYDKALEYMTNALHIYQRLNDSTGILKCKTNIGTTYTDLSALNNAQDYINEAIHLSRLLKNTHVEAVNLNNLGKLYFTKKNYRHAITSYQKALELEIKNNNLWSEANTRDNIGGAYMAEGFYSEALSYLNNARMIAEKIKANQLLTEIYENLYLLHYSNNDYATAIAFLKKHQVLSDSMHTINSRREIANADMRYKLNLKELQLKSKQTERELLFLKSDNQKYVFFIFVSLIAVLLLLLFILYYRNKAHQQAKKQEELKNSQISEKNILLEKALSAMKESEEKYRALSNSIQDGMVILQNQKLVYANDKLCNILGYESQAEMQNLQVEDVVAPEDVQMIVSNYDKRVKGEQISNNYPVVLRHKSGKTIETNLCVIRTQLHGVPAVIGTFKIVSELQKYEIQLRHEKQRAEQATLAKSLFLAGMSHEIRNHLNSIMGITEILVDSELTDELHQYVQVINSSGKKLMNIINDILDLSKIEAGQVNLDLGEFKIEQVLTDTVSMFELSARQQKLFLKTSIEPDIPPVIIGDMNRLSQVLINLTGNAFKFTDKGGVFIQLELVSKEQDQLTIKFNVIDTGIGISDDSKNKLFKAFSQTHSAIQRKQKGSGLGLVICKNIVELMNGEIGVESSPGNGSNFWFTASFGIPHKPTDSRESENKGNMNNKILLVEDNLLNQHLTTTILGKHGYTTDIADNGRIGVEMFRKKFYKIILMDIQMPEMDGIQATRLIREYESTNYLTQATIIAVTAHAKEGEKEKLFDAGMNHYISKPFKPDDLLSLLEYVKNA